MTWKKKNTHTTNSIIINFLIYYGSFCIYLWYRLHLVSWFCNLINLLSKLLDEAGNLTILTSQIVFFSAVVQRNCV